MEVVRDVGNPFLEITVEEVLKLTSEFDTGRATTDDDHVQKALDFLGILVLESCSFTAVHNALADLLSIANLLQEEAMLTDTRNTCGLCQTQSGSA